MSRFLDLDEMADAIRRSGLAALIAVERPDDDPDGGWVDIRFNATGLGDVVFVDSSGLIEANDSRMTPIPFSREKHALLRTILAEIDRQVAADSVAKP